MRIPLFIAATFVAQTTAATEYQPFSCKLRVLERKTVTLFTKGTPLPVIIGAERIDGKVEVLHKLTADYGMTTAVSWHVEGLQGKEFKRVGVYLDINKNALENPLCADELP